MAGEENLIPFNERTEEEQRAIAKKGGQASGKVRRERKAMKETLELLLAMPLTDKKQCDIEKVKSWAAMNGKNITVEQAIIVKQLQRALKGDLNAAAFIRDTSGQQPGQKVDFNGVVPVVISGEDELEE